MKNYLLAIDQGTTSSRAMVFDRKGVPVSKHQLKFKQYFPHPGWVEHDPEEIWQTTLTCCRQAIAKAHLTAGDIVACGITNQRETTVVWERQTGKPVYPAIVWQDRRTATMCQELALQGKGKTIHEKTGLLLDPYFSATKINWILNHVPNARERAENAELAFGTIDSFLLWRLTDGKTHATDISNASRTLLFNIHEQRWDEDLLTLFHVPFQMLPEVKENCAEFGIIAAKWLDDAIPVFAMAGDQQAALIGQTCLKSGMAKATFGTGCFLVWNTEEAAIASQAKLLTTIAYQFQGKINYALEGSIFSAGVILEWLKDNMGFLGSAEEAAQMAASVPDTDGVVMVPAFTGLGAPYWNPHVKAAILGMTRGTSIAHIVRAGLEAIAYQTCDLIEAMKQDCQTELKNLRVDGGLANNHWLMQFLADMLGVPVERPPVTETTALGVAYLAGLQAGFFQSLPELMSAWRVERRFEPQFSDVKRKNLYQRWLQVVKAVSTAA